MQGYVIHLSVAEEYLKKNKKTEQYEEFIEGVIYPDSIKDKWITHFGEKSSKSNLWKFLNEKDIKTSFNRGYFLHLLTDYLFYNHYVDTMTKDMYNDYDVLNDRLVEKYNVKIPEKVKEQIFSKPDGTLKILTEELVDKMVEEISNMDIDTIAEDVIANPEKWTKYRELKRTL